MKTKALNALPKTISDLCEVVCLVSKQYVWWILMARLTKKETLRFAGLNLRKWYHTYFSIISVRPDRQKCPSASQKMPRRAAKLSEHAKFLTRWGILIPFCNSWSKTPVFRIAQPLDVSAYYRAKQRRWTSGQIQGKSWRTSSLEAPPFVCQISAQVM